MHRDPFNSSEVPPEERSEDIMIVGEEGTRKVHDCAWCECSVSSQQPGADQSSDCSSLFSRLSYEDVWIHNGPFSMQESSLLCCECPSTDLPRPPDESSSSSTMIVSSSYPAASPRSKSDDEAEESILCPQELLTCFRFSPPTPRPPTTAIYSLPDEVTCSIFSFLSVSGLNKVRSLCKRFCDLGSSNGAGWSMHCENLWMRKVHISHQARRLKEHHAAMKAFRLSCRDGRFRHEIEEDHELCYDPASGSGTVWNFRFKESAGPDWTANDPWYSGKEARRMVFLRNGSVKQLVLEETTGNLLLRPVFCDSVYTESQHMSRLEVGWRMISHPMDLPMRPKGAYVRLNIAGRDVPTYVVHRSPTGNWGFVMENCWGVYASFPLPLRRMPGVPRNHFQYHSPVILPRMRLRRTHSGGRWFDVNGIESESEDENSLLSHSEASLLDDASLNVTSGWQWREAVLYNNGAASLPEGEGATAQFDRIWQQSLRFAETGSGVAIVDQDMHNFLR